MAVTSMSDTCSVSSVRSTGLDVREFVADFPELPFRLLGQVVPPVVCERVPIPWMRDKKMLCNIEEFIHQLPLRNHTEEFSNCGGGRIDAFFSDAYTLCFDQQRSHSVPVALGRE